MTARSATHWESVVEQLAFAFQPIVNIHTGVCYGYEALLRNHESCGFPSIGDVFDRAYAEGRLGRLEQKLRQKAVEKFAALPWHGSVRLFYNLDNRSLGIGDPAMPDTFGILQAADLEKSALCFEISERHELGEPDQVLSALRHYRSQGFKIAVDDFGTGFSGLQLLYYTEPDFVKIDRFFIREISRDQKKRLFVSSIVNIVHLLGGIVVAEGVETREEYFSCRAIGCDLVQGYLVQRPVVDSGALKTKYGKIEALSRTDRRVASKTDSKLILNEMEKIEPVFVQSDIFGVFKRFREDKEKRIYPVVNRNHEPVGVVREDSFKDYTYSPYGRELLQNPSFGKTVSKFVSKFPVVDINTPVEKVLEIYALNRSMEGILIVDGLKYAGFLSARSLLKVINEKNIAAARDQNPLSNLPGNVLIHEYVSEAISRSDRAYALVYFDFNDFKPYNDTYGFRHGDRMIILFADLLRKCCRKETAYAGHVGGDDFFMGVADTPAEDVAETVRRLQSQFQSDAESFYDIEAIKRGHIVSKSRDGIVKRFPLMTVSAAVLVLPKGRSKLFSNEGVGNIIAKLKKEAKADPESFCMQSIHGYEEKSSRITSLIRAQRQSASDDVAAVIRKGEAEGGENRPLPDDAADACCRHEQTARNPRGCVPSRIAGQARHQHGG